MSKKRLIIRQGEIGDINNLVILEKQVWGDEMGAAEDKWHSRLSIYPQGTFVCEGKKRLTGVVVTHVIDWVYSDNYYPTWEEATDNGFITNHNNKGDTMYGVNLSVLSDNPGVASGLLKRAIDKTKERKITQGYLGCRIPSLADYMKRRKTKHIAEGAVKSIARFDPEVKFFIQNGFRIIAARKNYFKSDIDSLGWGIILKLL